MGTPSASNFAHLYLAYYEETLTIPEFKNCIALIKRFFFGWRLSRMGSNKI